MSLRGRRSIFEGQSLAPIDSSYFKTPIYQFWLNLDTPTRFPVDFGKKCEKKSDLTTFRALKKIFFTQNSKKMRWDVLLAHLNLLFMQKNLGYRRRKSGEFVWTIEKKTPKVRMTPSYKNQKPFCQVIIRNMLYFSETRAKMDTNEKKNFWKWPLLVNSTAKTS